MTGDATQRLEPVVAWRVDHYQQRHHWDCGLSCCIMVLPDQLRNQLLTNFNQVVEEEGFGESTWTIDLCYLLHRYGILFSYCTITIGIDPGYSRENFYDKVLSKDSQRVNDRFSNAESLGMKIEQRSVSTEEITNHVSEVGPVIVLTNANQLYCSQCSPVSYACYSSCLRSCSASYQGHYILLVGYNRDTKEVAYRNPTFRDKVCSMPLDTLDECRSAYGTDEDLIFIHSASHLS